MWVLTQSTALEAGSGADGEPRSEAQWLTQGAGTHRVIPAGTSRLILPSPQC